MAKNNCSTADQAATSIVSNVLALRDTGQLHGRVPRLWRMVISSSSDTADNSFKLKGDTNCQVWFLTCFLNSGFALNILAALGGPMTATHDIGRTINNSSSAPFVELHQSLCSRVAAISPFVDQLMRFIKLFMGRVSSTKEAEEEVEIAIREALANAVIHGNHENQEKQVHVACRCGMDGEVVICVRDEGEGFDCRAVPDPTGAERLLLSHGRGLHIMKALMDEVSFEENGTVIRMRKRMKAQRRSL